MVAIPHVDDRLSFERDGPWLKSFFFQRSEGVLGYLLQHRRGERCGNLALNAAAEQLYHV